MSQLQHVHVEPRDPHRFGSVLSAPAYSELLDLIERGARQLEGRVIWNVNSTARGGGVVELLRPLLGYSRGSGVDARWLVISGDADFFEVTKRLHNALHGMDGDGGPLGPRERRDYEQRLAANAVGLMELVRPEDVVILHDPQTAGLIEAVRATGALCIWRCHIGADRHNDRACQGWEFLAPFLGAANAYVFSRAAYVWEHLDARKVAVIQPSIDAFSPKNAEQPRQRRLAILDAAGVISAPGHGTPTFVRSDSSPGRVDRRAKMVQETPLSAEHQVVVQISRWDRLKDPLGVMLGFSEHVAARTAAHLLLAGPDTDAVADDPEGAQVFAAVCDGWRGLPDAVRRRVHLAALPMDDVEENAALVGALQHHADVVVQKSLAEGFGLTVAEAMWKQRPVVGSEVGGIQDQIVDGESGVLIRDPGDLAAFGAAVSWLLNDPARRRRLGAAARERVREHFLAPHHLSRYFELIEHLGSGTPVATPLQHAAVMDTTGRGAQP